MPTEVSNKEFLKIFIKEKKCSFVECKYSCPIYHSCRVLWSERVDIDMCVNNLREEAIKHYLMLYGEGDLFDQLL
jgi:hypothetical protein